MSSLWRYSVAVLALVTLLAPLSVSGSEVWVDSNVGSAGNKPGCGTSAVPCGTIGYALSTQQNGPIEIVLVEGRTYSDSGDINLIVTGRNATFRTSDGNAATVIDCAGRGTFLKFSNPDRSERTMLELNMHTLTVTNCASTYGGAVSTFGVVNVLLTHCNFLNNRASMRGGAVSVGHIVSKRPLAWPTLKLSGVNTFYNNTAAGLGGAIYSNYSSIDISGTHFEGNVAGIGGAINWLSSYYMKVVSSNFKLNRAIAQGSDGGSAIFATSASDIIIDDVTFDGNHARGGGTVNIYFGPSLTLSKSTFTNNRADVGGGGLYVGSSAKASVSSTTFISNGGSSGGAIHVNSATLTATGVTAKGNSAAFGGAVYFANSVGTITNAQFDGNSAEKGAAIYASNQCQIKLTSCRILNNFAKSKGSGLFCDKSEYTLTGVSFTNNTAGSTRVSSRAQDVYCDTEESYGYCTIDGDAEWNGHCKLVKDNSPKIPVPKWLVAVIISLAVFILLLVLAVAFWMYRVRRVKHGYSKAADGGEGYTMVAGDEQEQQLFGVLTKPNDIHYADDTEEDEDHTDDDDGLIRNRTVN